MKWPKAFKQELALKTPEADYLDKRVILFEKRKKIKKGREMSLFGDNILDILTDSERSRLI